jgi:hypothetical protein
MKRLVAIAVAVVLTCMAVMVNTAYAEHDSLTGGSEQDNGTEFHVVDDLYVGGWNGTWDDADVEIYGFSIFGSSTVAGSTKWDKMKSVISPSTGSVVILGNLAVASTAYIEGITIATSAADTSKLRFETDATNNGKVLQLDSNGYVKFVSVSSLGDNLGDHTATQNLNMNDHAIIKVSSITFSNESLAISSGSAYFGGENAGITVSTNVEVVGQIKAAKFVGDGSGLTGTGDNLGTHIATKTLDMAGYDIIRIKELSLGSSENVKISTATNQFGGEGAGVLISTHAEVSGQLYVGDAATMASTLNVTGNATMSANLTVNGNATIKGNAQLGDGVTDTHTIYGSLQAGALDSGKFMQIKDNDGRVVAYFKKK